MYIFSRILSLMIYCLILVIVCIFIKNITKKKLDIIILKLYIMVLFVMGYFFIPHEGADLTRVIIAMNSYRDLNFSGLLYEILNSTTPGVPIYYYLISKLNNVQLLPAISAFIIFTFCFGILINILVRKDSTIKTSDIAISLFVFMSRGLFLQSISNIRTMLSLAILAWCIYQEFYNNKTFKYLSYFYLLAASFHVMGQIILVYRIVYFIFGRSRSKIRKIMKIISIAAIVLVSLYGADKYINNILKLFNLYNSATISGEGYSYIWERILSVITIIYCLYLIKYYKHSNKLKSYSIAREKTRVSTIKLIAYLYPLLWIDVAAFFVEFNFFQRLSWYIAILCIPLVVFTLREDNLTRKKHQKILILFSTLVLILACIRGDLCSLKFFLI